MHGRIIGSFPFRERKSHKGFLTKEKGLPAFNSEERTRRAKNTQIAGEKGEISLLVRKSRGRGGFMKPGILFNPGHDRHRKEALSDGKKRETGSAPSMRKADPELSEREEEESASFPIQRMMQRAPSKTSL